MVKLWQQKDEEGNLMVIYNVSSNKKFNENHLFGFLR